MKNGGSEGPGRVGETPEARRERMRVVGGTDYQTSPEISTGAPAAESREVAPLQGGEKYSAEYLNKLYNEIMDQIPPEFEASLKDELYLFTNNEILADADRNVAGMSDDSVIEILEGGKIGNKNPNPWQHNQFEAIAALKRLRMLADEASKREGDDI